MQHIAPDIVSYEHGGAPRYVGIDGVREVCRQGLESSFAWVLDHVTAEGTETRSRGTRVFECRAGRWQMIHQHLSIPARQD